MPLILTSAQRRTLDARRSDDPYLWLATFTHRDVSQPIRVVKNSEDIVSQGETFHRGWFDLEVPHDQSEPPRGRISIPNISREFSSLLLRLRTPPRVRLQAVLASDPDTVVEDYDFLFLRGVQGDKDTLSGTLDSWNFTTEPWPAAFATEADYPGVWL